MDFEVAEGLALFIALLALEVLLAAHKLQMRDQASLLEELFLAVIALELLLAAVLHVRQLFVDRVEFYAAEGAREDDVRKELWMLVLEVVREERDCFVAGEVALINRAGENRHVNHQQVVPALLLLLEPSRAVTTTPSEVRAKIWLLLRLIRRDLSLNDDGTGWHWDLLLDVGFGVVFVEVKVKRDVVDVERVASVAGRKRVVMRHGLEDFVAVEVGGQQLLIFELEVAVDADIFSDLILERRHEEFVLNLALLAKALLLEVLVDEMIPEASGRVRRVKNAVAAAVNVTGNAELVHDLAFSTENLVSNPIAAFFVQRAEQNCGL